MAHLLASGSVLKAPEWTVGASTHVLFHAYDRQRITVEVLDVSGSRRYPHARTAFYQEFDGVVLVHDVTNLSSFRNLRSWLHEALGGSPQWRSAPAVKGVTGTEAFGDAVHSGLHTRGISSPSRPQQTQHGLEALAPDGAGGVTVPVLIVGTKLDLKRGASYAQLPAIFNLDDAIQVSTHDTNAFGEHSREGMMFRSFLDHVIVRQSSNSYCRAGRRRDMDVSEEV